MVRQKCAMLKRAIAKIREIALSLEHLVEVTEKRINVEFKIRNTNFRSGEEDLKKMFDNCPVLKKTSRKEDIPHKIAKKQESAEQLADFKDIRSCSVNPAKSHIKTHKTSSRQPGSQGKNPKEPGINPFSLAHNHNKKNEKTPVKSLEKTCYKDSEKFNPKKHHKLKKNNTLRNNEKSYNSIPNSRAFLHRQKTLTQHELVTLAIQTSPLMDRLGRMLTDFAPHVAHLADGYDTVTRLYEFSDELEGKGESMGIFGIKKNTDHIRQRKENRRSHGQIEREHRASGVEDTLLRNPNNSLNERMNRLVGLWQRRQSIGIFDRMKFYSSAAFLEERGNVWPSIRYFYTRLLSYMGNSRFYYYSIWRLLIWPTCGFVKYINKY